jgi:hypothetical protein
MKGFNVLQQLFHLFQGSGASDILAALLTVIGGFRLIAQYTPWQADDHFFAAIESPVKLAASFLSKLKGDK